MLEPLWCALFEDRKLAYAREELGLGASGRIMSEEAVANGCEQPKEKQENAVSSEEVNSEPQPKATGQEQSHPSTQEQEVAPPAPATAPTIKHDWYQTQTDVYVNVMVKRLKRDDVSVEFGDRSLDVFITLGDGRNHSLAFTLAHDIVPQKSTFKVLSTKVSLCVDACIC